MNLNPLKKEDNTDALVKALEDANNVGAMQPGVTPSAAPDSAAIAADPQVVSAGVADQPVVTSAAQTTTDAATLDTQTNDQTAHTPEQAPTEEITVPEIDTTSTDTTTGVNFSGTNDLPDGMSSDADAHLSGEGSGEDGELDGVKKSALEELRPLIEKLDLEPADKFDKYLMMLRASDDPALIKPAFEAAQGISGEKEKAQALLDIINEINYITASQQK